MGKFQYKHHKDSFTVIKTNTDNRIDQLILNRYPDNFDEIKSIIEQMKTTYDEDQFLEEDILESILIELDII